MAESGLTMNRSNKVKDIGKNKYAFACSIVASFISILMGYDTGVMSGAMLFIQEDLKVSDTQIQVLAGILNLCALVGSLTAGRVSDLIGRRYTIVVGAVIFFIGSLFMGLGLNFAMLIAGRCIAGVGVGYALMIAPVYSAEISSPSSRGFLSSLPEICISLGILIGYLANYVFGKLPLVYGWRAMLGVAVVPSVALAFSVLLMPESPRWLAMQGRIKDAANVLRRLTNSKEEAERRLEEIKTTVGIDKACDGDVVQAPGKHRGEGVWRDLLLRPTPTVRRVLTAAIGVHFFQHATGIEAVVLYSPRIFKKAGLVTKNQQFLATIGVGVVKTTFILLAILLVDRVGRRKLFLSSITGMILSLTGLGVVLTMIEHSQQGLRLSAEVLCLVFVYSFVASFSIGLGPVTWVYCSEIFPLRLRAQGASLGVAVNRVMNSAMSMSFVSLYKAITIGGAFFLFAGVGVVAWVFYFLCCPETRGRALEEEMEEVFLKPKDKKLRNNEGV
ncbi:putative polyol transporter 6 isoform X1 [Canna indica]|uniref:Polyol transporter 6 isoform X1 n=1 Tax=Canna indica TaxID=4628 RepID=A0AAQ3L3E5_9LILI|nr:putative polyol transporter 6 isoform X1 [Canna indica]